MKKFFRRLNEPPITNRVAFEIWILLASFLSGLGIVISGQSPDTIDIVLVTPFLQLWVMGLLLGPTIIIFSLIRRNRLKGLILEYYTLIPFGAIIIFYGGNVLSQLGVSGILTAFTAISAGISCWTTAWLIRKKLKEAKLWISRQEL